MIYLILCLPSHNIYKDKYEFICTIIIISKLKLFIFFSCVDVVVNVKFSEKGYTKLDVYIQYIIHMIFVAIAGKAFCYIKFMK